MVSCDKIRLKGMVMEDFVNYKVPSMFLITSICDWKCCKEANIDISICQNQSLTKQPTKTYSYESIYQAYVNNPITKAIVIGGLEPFDQFEEIFQLILYFRAQGCDDMFVIYTRYNKFPNTISNILVFNSFIMSPPLLFIFLFTLNFA